MATESHVHIPSDNLYKFVAIFTTVLIPTLLIAALGLVETFAEDYDIEELWSAVIGEVGDGTVLHPPPPPPPLAADADAVPPPPVTVDDMGDEEPDRGLQMFSWLMRGALGGLVCLFLTAMLGFMLWYLRLQRYRDRLIRVEALTAEITYQLVAAGKVVPSVNGLGHVSDKG